MNQLDAVERLLIPARQASRELDMAMDRGPRAIEEAAKTFREKTDLAIGAALTFAYSGRPSPAPRPCSHCGTTDHRTSSPMGLACGRLRREAERQIVRRDAAGQAHQ